ncbi:MAG: hypothetical protein LUG16_01830 [Candidatus Gastranaerophilales bacterium]|nr:hypothetical protein [Candidatus Gastranaerophilales bacterium]
MEVSKVNGVSNSQSFAQNDVKTTENSKPAEIKDGKKKLALALGALAVTGAVVATGVIAAKKGKLNIKNLKDITFDKGTALNKDGSKFTGIIEDTLKSGDKIKMNYVDGAIKTSQRTGSQNWTKKFCDIGSVVRQDGNSVRCCFKQDNEIFTQELGKFVNSFDTRTGKLTSSQDSALTNDLRPFKALCNRYEEIWR